MPFFSFFEKSNVDSEVEESTVMNHLRVEDEKAKESRSRMKARSRVKGYCRGPKYSNPKGAAHIPRQYIVPTHGDNFDALGANSLKAAIAITDILGAREL